MKSAKFIDKVLLITGSTRMESSEILHEISDFFEQSGIKYLLYRVNRKPEEWPGEPGDLSGINLAISLGGDGTLLYCAKIVAGKNIPILAVNLGDFGFITEISKSEWKDAYYKYIENRLKISSRMMLKVCVERNGKLFACYLGLNDGVIGTGGISRIIRLKVYISGTYIGRYKADGVIVATPTGSTAYSVAAGGPILYPGMEALILNPICPFTLSNRPIVFPGNEVLEIEVEEHQRTDVILSIDGQESFPLKPGDRVIFKKSSKKTLILQSDRRNFYEVLRKKLNWAGEPNA